MTPMKRFSLRVRVTAALAFGVTAVLVAACGSRSWPADDDAIAPIDTALVVEVIDGDTVVLEIGGQTETVRLVGIDTPETVHPTKPVECFGPQASAFLSRLLPVDTQVRIQRDTQARDSYGRLLLYVFLPAPAGEKFVNLELVARGFAVPLSIEPNTHWRDSFVAAAFDAQRNSRGLWRACK
jgi:micrococcal nuclease